MSKLIIKPRAIGPSERMFGAFDRIAFAAAIETLTKALALMAAKVDYDTLLEKALKNGPGSAADTAMHMRLEKALKEIKRKQGKTYTIQPNPNRHYYRRGRY